MCERYLGMYFICKKCKHTTSKMNDDEKRFLDEYVYQGNNSLFDILLNNSVVIFLF